MLGILTWLLGCRRASWGIAVYLRYGAFCIYQCQSGSLMPCSGDTAEGSSPVREVHWPVLHFLLRRHVRWCSWPERERPPGASDRYQGRDRLCCCRAVSQGSGAGCCPRVSCRDRAARHSRRAVDLHARDDSHDLGFTHSHRHVCRPRWEQSGQRRHLSHVRIARGRDGPRHAPGRGHTDLPFSTWLSGLTAARKTPSRF